MPNVDSEHYKTKRHLNGGWMKQRTKRWLRTSIGVYGYITIKIMVAFFLCKGKRRDTCMRPVVVPNCYLLESTVPTTPKSSLRCNNERESDAAAVRNDVPTMLLYWKPHCLQHQVGFVTCWELQNALDIWTLTVKVIDLICDDELKGVVWSTEGLNEPARDILKIAARPQDGKTKPCALHI